MSERKPAKPKRAPSPRKGGDKGVDWIAVKHTFINGTMSLGEHAATYGVTFDRMRQRASRGKWIAERNALSQTVAAVAQAKLIKTKVQELAEFDAADASMSRALRTVAAKMLRDSAQQGARKLTPSEARTIASLAESAQKIGRIALGGATENVGVGGMAGAPPITSAVVPAKSAAVQQAMRDYLAGNGALPAP